ncbi:MAG: protein kinase [Planctomycetales bacterium]|nr:protein kinase [Planctomycetales bacterium]
METLRQLIDREGPLDLRRAAQCVVEVADQLAAIHISGRVFRDVRPSSIFLDQLGRATFPKLDLRVPDAAAIYGASADVDSLDDAVDFLAPEQALNSLAVDARADIYSLGCTFYFVLTARPPFAGGSASERLLKHQTARRPDLREMRAGVPAEIAELCSEMLEKNATDRPPNAHAISERLRAWLEK